MVVFARKRDCVLSPPADVDLVFAREGVGRWGRVCGRGGWGECCWVRWGGGGGGGVIKRGGGEEGKDAPAPMVVVGKALRMTDR